MMKQVISQHAKRDPAISAGFSVFKSFTARLALVYIALFSFSVILLFGFIYGFAIRYVENQINTSIENQFSRLYYTYRNDGSEEVERVIRSLIRSDEEGTEIYILTNKEGERVAGNMESWPQFAKTIKPYPPRGKWIEFQIEGTRNHPYPITVRAISYRLSKWRNLLVGESLLDKRKAQQIIAQTFWASLLVTIVIAFIGAMLMTRSIVSRINVINRSAETIIEGDISARIPRSGVGDQFDMLSENLNTMLDKIEALLQSLSDFSNNIAHDLRTPLNRIIARTEAGIRGLKENSAARKLLVVNVEEMQELVGTFNSILRISELESAGDQQEFQQCDASLVVQDMVELYEPIATEKQQRIQTDIDASVFINAEPKLLAQALANLLDNAIKFSPNDTEIQVKLKQVGEQTTLSVMDEGPGIPEDSREKVFDKFVRLEDSRSESGNGLGLSLVAAVARIHGAEVTLEDNNPGLRVKLLFS